MNSPKVSIVLPTRNRAQLLSAAIENCLAQSYTNIELIIVNDASSDSTAAILAGYLDNPRVQVISCASNVGLPRGLNIGFAASRGEYLTWTSDDNAYAPGAIEKMVETLEHNVHHALVYADAWSVYPGGRREPRPMADPLYMIEVNCVGACFLYRRSVMEKIGGYCPDLLLAEDYDFFLRAFLSGFKFYHLRERLYDYAVHDASLGATEGHDKVRLQAARVLQLRLKWWQREWIRLKRRTLIALKAGRRLFHR